MTAGNNLGVRIWRIVNATADDEVGGALPSGTVLYEHAHARFSQIRPTTPLLEQGMEVNKLYSFFVEGRYIEIEENDILEITSPVIHRDYGKKYRAVAIQRQSFAPNDRRQYLLVTTTRIERSHGNDYQ